MSNPDVPLGTAEQFLLTMSSINELAPRLHLWSFKLDYDQLERVSTLGSRDICTLNCVMCKTAYNTTEKVKQLSSFIEILGENIFRTCDSGLRNVPKQYHVTL